MTHFPRGVRFHPPWNDQIKHQRKVTTVTTLFLLMTIHWLIDRFKKVYVCVWVCVFVGWETTSRGCNLRKISWTRFQIPYDRGSSSMCCLCGRKIASGNNSSIRFCDNIDSSIRFRLNSRRFGVPFEECGFLWDGSHIFFCYRFLDNWLHCSKCKWFVDIWFKSFFL